MSADPARAGVEGLIVPRRAATAEQIHARAMEEYRLRDAEAKAAKAAAADAQALFERAAEAARRAEEARNAEVSQNCV